MALTIQAENIHDAAEKLGLRDSRADISIKWRRGPAFDYRETPETGCIVDARSVPGEEVARAFKTSAEAVRYIAAMLKKHDQRAKEVKDERARKIKHDARLARALARQKRQEQPGPF
jgi:hypothetical protein